MAQRDAEKYDRKRGRHKKRASRETRAWNAAHLPAVPPAWMDSETTRRLRALRRELEARG